MRIFIQTNQRVLSRLISENIPQIFFPMIHFTKIEDRTKQFISDHLESKQDFFCNQPAILDYIDPHFLYMLDEMGNAVPFSEYENYCERLDSSYPGEIVRNDTHLC